MSEYPKVIDVDGLTITAVDADDEARWRTPRAEPAPVVDAPLVVPAEASEPVAPVEPPTKKAAKKGKAK